MLKNLPFNTKRILVGVFVVLVVVVAGALILNQLSTGSPSLSQKSYNLSGTSGMGMLGLEAPSASPSYGVAADSVRSSGKVAYSESAQDQDSSSGELTERKVVKDGQLQLLVQSADSVAAEIKKLATALDGFVSDSQVYEVRDGVKAGQVTIRVPAARFDEAMEGIKSLAVKVEREQVEASDVTEQYIDLESRLQNLEAQETQYLEVLKKASKIEDILMVTQYLNQVRSEIERIEGQLKYLSQQVDMSTITARLTSESDVEVFGLRWRPLYIGKLALRDMFANMADYVDSMIGFIFKLPVIILWLATIGLIAWVAWRVLLWLGRKFGFVKKPDTNDLSGKTGSKK